MGPIEEIQLQLGAPLVGFVQQNWLFVLVIVALVAFYLVGATTSSDSGLALWSSDDIDGDGGSDGGDGGGSD